MEGTDRHLRRQAAARVVIRHVLPRVLEVFESELTLADQKAFATSIFRTKHPAESGKATPQALLICSHAAIGQTEAAFTNLVLTAALALQAALDSCEQNRTTSTLTATTPCVVNYAETLGITPEEALSDIRDEHRRRYPATDGSITARTQNGHFDT